MNKNLIIALVVLILAVGTVAVLTKKDKPAETDDQSQYTNDWQKVVQPSLGFTFDYPSNWFTAGQSETETYVTNQSVGSPMEMTGEGVWVAVQRAPNAAFYDKLVAAGSQGVITEGSSKTTVVGNTTFGGTTGIKYTSEILPGTDTEYLYTTGFAMKKDNSVYLIKFNTFDKATADKNSDTFNKLVDSFRPLPPLQ